MSITAKKGPLEEARCPECDNRILFFRYFPDGRTYDEDPRSITCTNCGRVFALPHEMSPYKSDDTEE